MTAGVYILQNTMVGGGIKIATGKKMKSEGRGNKMNKKGKGEKEKGEENNGLKTTQIRLKNASLRVINSKIFLGTEVTSSRRLQA